jgi:hypothetical protein
MKLDTGWATMANDVETMNDLLNITFNISSISRARHRTSLLPLPGSPNNMTIRTLGSSAASGFSLLASQYSSLPGSPVERSMP